jgi:hypothetical protein
MNALETLTYETKAMLEVTSDGLLNEPCPSNPEDSAAVLRMAVEKIEKIRAIHEEIWDEKRREAVADDGDNEDADGDENFDTKDVFSDLSDAVDEWEEKEVESIPCFNVEELEVHEDGSATYQVSGSNKEMKQLFEVFFTHALINGIKHTREDNDKEIAKLKSIETARELEVLLREWETSEEFDYSPVVRDKRLKLKELLDKAGV